MLKIRLQRTGKKHDPSFRVVLVDSRKAPKSGSFLEILGNYNTKKGNADLKAERIAHWISKGAQASNTVHNLLVEKKIIEGEKRDVLHHAKIKAKKEKKSEKEAKAEAPAGQPEQKEEEPAEEEKKEEQPAETA